ncbi:MAG: hypothetical protein ACI4UE_02350 [Candidatus Scatovivens sp.]
MSVCLGIHIEDDVIKYAKVKKEKDSIKVEAFNIVFYEDLKTTIKQIINETNSTKIPISINLSGEMYNYFQVSSMLSKPDRKKAVEIDFDLLCEERNYKKNTLETRFLFAPSLENPERIQAIAISGTQADLAQKKLDFSGVKIDYIHPLTTSITNLIEPNETSNIAIINIEEQTKITIMSKGQIAKIDIISEGMKDIINKINMVENSKQKSYEVCKNTTIYSQDNGENISEGNEHIESIMPTLYSIVSKSKEIIEDAGINISKIYITGLATSINNIDLYFQEYFEKIKCEILRPFFANVTSIKTSIKDYIEVNSAIALALNGIGYGYRELNFSGNNKNVNLKGILGNSKSNAQFSGVSGFSGKLDAVERMVTRITFTCLIALLGYVVFVNVISNQIDSKTEEVSDKIVQVEKEINKANSDISQVKKQTDNYKSAIEELDSLEENQKKLTIINKVAIPTLLYNLVTITPKKVQIISIENVAETNHIVIQAQSEDYEQLGFLKAAITTNNYLLNVKSTSGVKSGKLVSTTIEGDLP